MAGKIVIFATALTLIVAICFISTTTCDRFSNEVEQDERLNNEVSSPLSKIVDILNSKLQRQGRYYTGYHHPYGVGVGGASASASAVASANSGGMGYGYPIGYGR